MYFFNARWLDASLGRFIQADTIIPSPYDPTSYDRYAYANNSPVNYLDPSGHSSTSTCRVYRDDVCVVPWGNASPTYYYIFYLQKEYGITLSNDKGTWTLVNMKNLVGALDNMNSALGDLGGISRFTSGTTFYYYFDSTYYGGKTSDYTGNITFHSPESGIPYQNIYHEVAHLIDVRSGGYFSSHLSRKVYAPDGTFIMGGLDTNYHRNSLGYANRQVKDPSGQTVDAQQHPAGDCSIKDGGCNADKEWADLVANYVAGNFDSDIGTTRQNWVNNVWGSYLQRFNPFTAY